MCVAPLQTWLLLRAPPRPIDRGLRRLDRVKVDDLDDINNLDEYIAKSMVLLLFAADHYFTSWSCQNEIKSVLKWRRPFFHVHEADPKHGGKPWATLKAKCPAVLEASGRFGALPDEYIAADGRGDYRRWERDGWFQRATRAPTREVTLEFAKLILEGQTPIMWHRLPDFQQIALKSIATQTLRHSPTKANSGELYIPGELLRQRLEPASEVVLFVSKSNPGAAEFVAELRAAYPSIDLTHKLLSRPIVAESAAQMALGAASGAAESALVGAADSTLEGAGATLKAAGTALEAETKAGTVTIGSVGATLEAAGSYLDAAGAHLGSSGRDSKQFLLYLNEATFVGEEGKQLADEVSTAMQANMPIVLAYELDPTKGSCQFERFFTTTPSDLIQRGLYKKLALACYPGVLDRQGSLAVIVKVGFGFVEAKGGVADHLTDFTNQAGRVVEKKRSRPNSLTTKLSWTYPRLTLKRINIPVVQATTTKRPHVVDVQMNV